MSGSQFFIEGPAQGQPPAPRMLPTDYVRPEIGMETFTDAAGAVIAYGERWGRDSPALDSYSVCAHPERFRPVLSVAQELIDHLRSHYQVSVLQGKAVTLTPARGAALRLRMRDESDYVGVEVRAGAITRALFPVCACDACDEDVISLVEDLELFVFAVVQGDLSEWRRGRWVGYRVHLGDGADSHSSWKADRQQRRRLRARQIRYPAWLPDGL